MRIINLVAFVVLNMVAIGSFGQHKNSAPKIDYISIDGKKSPSVVPLNPGEKYLVKVVATDPEGDKLKAKWELFAKTEISKAIEEKRKPVAIPDMVTGSLENVMLDVPIKQGGYRLILTVSDGVKNVTTSSIDLQVLE